ncbi:MAG: hypothetical protein F4135_09525 [Acidimicrobiia bacterium]|nr:hypothetical protein [Acidimicrobiia bacterium]
MPAVVVGEDLEPQWRAGYVARRSEQGFYVNRNPIFAAMEGGLRSPPEPRWTDDALDRHVEPQWRAG